MKWNAAGLGRRRPKLKKGRVPNTQIGFQLATFKAKGQESQKIPSCEAASNPPHGISQPKILHHPEKFPTFAPAFA